MRRRITDERATRSSLASTRAQTRYTVSRYTRDDILRIAFGAIVNHAVNTPITNAIPAIILLILSLAVAWLRGGDFAAAATRLLPPPTR